MKKNQKILGLLLLAVVVMFTMCKPKTKSDNNSSETTNRESLVSSSLVDSLKLIDTGIVHFYFTDNFDEKNKGLAWFKYRINIPQLDPTLTTFVAIDGNTPIQISEGNSMFSFQKNVILNGTDSLHISIRIFSKDAGGNIVGDTTKTDNTICPDQNTNGNTFFTKLQVGSAVFWCRNASATGTQYPTITTQTTTPRQVVTWPPSYNK